MTFLLWYFASMLISFPLTYQWISYLLKEHRKKEIEEQAEEQVRVIDQQNLCPGCEPTWSHFGKSGIEEKCASCCGVFVHPIKEWLTREELEQLGDWAEEFEKQAGPTFQVAGRGPRVEKSHWVPPTPEHNKVVMPRGMGGSSSPSKKGDE